MLTTTRESPNKITSTPMMRSAKLGVVVILVVDAISSRASEPRGLLVVRSLHVRVAGIPRTDRVGGRPRIAHRPRVQASLGIDHRGNPPRPAITSQLAAATRRPIVFRPRHHLHAFPSLY
jgi:hypothetical protein